MENIDIDIDNDSLESSSCETFEAFWDKFIDDDAPPEEDTKPHLEVVVKPWNILLALIGAVAVGAIITFCPRGTILQF